jgi:predicted nucleotidyltransferase
MKQIFKTIYGSRLYGTSTTSSDYDYKGVFLPPKQNLYLGRCPKSTSSNTNNDSCKNSSKDIDFENYSIQFFLKLASQGQTVALDMLHVQRQQANIWSPTWEFLHKNRKKFHTKSLKSYFGYCRKQASKYGVKGSRLSDVKRVIDLLQAYINSGRGSLILNQIWDILPEGEHIEKIIIAESMQKDKRAYSVCGRKVMATSKIEYIMSVFQKIYDNYGERAKKAESNKGIDWKAISHAFRAGLQLKEIYTTNDLVFPLKDAKFLLEIKNGKLNFKNDVQKQLEDLIDEIEILSSKSEYPEKVDISFFENFIIECYKKEGI